MMQLLEIRMETLTFIAQVVAFIILGILASIGVATLVILWASYDKDDTLEQRTKRREAIRELYRALVPKDFTA